MCPRTCTATQRAHSQTHLQGLIDHAAMTYAQRLIFNAERRELGEITRIPVEVEITTVVSGRVAFRGVLRELPPS